MFSLMSLYLYLSIGISVFSVTPYVIYTRLCDMPHLVKMFGGNVNASVEPADRPSVKVEMVEYSFVAQWGKELILLNERQAVENALAAIIEG